MPHLEGRRGRCRSCGALPGGGTSERTGQCVPKDSRLNGGLFHRAEQKLQGGWGAYQKEEKIAMGCLRGTAHCKLEVGGVRSSLMVF